MLGMKPSQSHPTSTSDNSEIATRRRRRMQKDASCDLQDIVDDTVDNEFSYFDLPIHCLDCWWF